MHFRLEVEFDDDPSVMDSFLYFWMGKVHRKMSDLC